MKNGIIVAVILTLPLFGDNKYSCLGSGGRDLYISIVHDVNASEFTFEISQNHIFLFKETLSGQLSDIDKHYLRYINKSNILFAFDENTAIDAVDTRERKICTSGNLFQLRGEHLSVRMGVGGSESRRLYGLKENERFLGRLGKRVFFISDEINKIFYFDLNQNHVRCHIDLPPNVIYVYGVAYGRAPNAISVYVHQKVIFYVAPTIIQWIDLKY
jgi:hypothetical protein